MNEPKYFVGAAEMSKTKPSRGINEYEMTQDFKGNLVFVLNGTFTVEELQAFVDALTNKIEEFTMSTPPRDIPLDKP